MLERRKKLLVDPNTPRAYTMDISNTLEYKNLYLYVSVLVIRSVVYRHVFMLRF